MMGTSPDQAKGSPLSTSCPDAVRSQLRGLYQWHINTPDRSGFSAQRDRFTPELFDQLMQAFALTSQKHGRFVDFDIFSGTQVRIFGYRLIACFPHRDGAVDAVMAVQVGLRGPSENVPQLLRYVMQQDALGVWRIADLSWPSPEPSRLSDFLRRLLS